MFYLTELQNWLFVMYFKQRNLNNPTGNQMLCIRHLMCNGAVMDASRSQKCNDEDIGIYPDSVNF